MSSTSFPAPSYAALMIEAPWPNYSMLTPAKTRAPTSLAKAGVTMGVVVFAAGQKTSCWIMGSWSTSFQLTVQ